MGTHGKRGSRTTVVGLPTLLAFLAALALAACGGSSTTASTPPSAATLPSVTPSPSETPLPTPTVVGTIAFIEVEGDQANVYAVRTDGSGTKRLAGGPGWREHPTWSPDGRRIAFQMGPESENLRDLWVMNADGSEKRQLTKGSVDNNPSWSPDGKRIVFQRILGSGWGDSFIFVVDTDGSGLKRLTSATGAKVEGDTPLWLPDGRIAFRRNGTFWAMRLDGSGLARLGKVGGSDVPEPSPDGKKVARLSADGERVEIIPTKGGGAPVTLLDNVSGYITADPGPTMAWAPDRWAVAVAGIGPYGSPIYIVNADGSGLAMVPGIDTAFNPSWRPG